MCLIHISIANAPPSGAALRAMFPDDESLLLNIRVKCSLSIKGGGT